MSVDFQRVKDIFLEAVEQTGPPEREACLRQACGDDDALRRRVEVLLRRHDQAHSILERPPFESAAMLVPQSAGTDDPAPQQEAAGTRLGPYKLLQKIGEGGMGRDYAAYDRELEREVALKVLRPDAPNDGERERIRREARILASLEHPNIVAVTDYGVAGSTPYLVMELLSGETLAQRLARGAVEPNAASTLAFALLRALAFAHRRGLLHRDVKPGNVFLQQSGDGSECLKLLDFGLAKFTADSAGSSALR